jgi:hypothetical protein
MARSCTPGQKTHETNGRFSGYLVRVNRIAFVVTYLAGAAAAVVLLNANSGNGELAIAIWAVASVLLGWGTGQLGFVFLALLAIPFAVPFGYPDHYQYSEPLPIWWSAMFCAFASAFLIFAGALIKKVVEARRHQQVPS